MFIDPPKEAYDVIRLYVRNNFFFLVTRCTKSRFSTAVVVAEPYLSQFNVIYELKTVEENDNPVLIVFV